MRALVLFNSVEPFSHVEHLHLDELQVDLLVIIADIKTLECLLLLLELVERVKHFTVTLGHISKFDSVIKVDEPFVILSIVRGELGEFKVHAIVK